ncbi:hypothetical protein Tco_0211131 [Tanacetum coccineum]
MTTPRSFGCIPDVYDVANVDGISFKDGLSAIATKLGTPLMFGSYTSNMCMKSWGRSSYARAMIELRVLCPNLLGSGSIHDECPKNIGSCVAKNLRNSSQVPRGVPVGLKMGFKPAKQVCRPVSKKTNANTSGNKKKDVESTKEIERLIIDWKVILVDDEGKLLDKVNSSCHHDSEDEVESVDNEMASFVALKKFGYGTNSLLEQ